MEVLAAVLGGVPLLGQAMRGVGRVRRPHNCAPGHYLKGGGVFGSLEYPSSIRAATLRILQELLRGLLVIGRELTLPPSSVRSC